MSATPDRHSRWSSRQETLWVVGGLLAFSVIYYLRTPLASAVGLLILVGTAALWGYSVRRVHPLGPRDFRLTVDRWPVHVLVALIASLVGIVYTQVYSLVTRGRWQRMSYGGSIPVLASILLVVIAEELFFNGYLLTRMRAFSASPWLRPLFVVLTLSLYKVSIHLWDGRPPVYYVELFVVETVQSYAASWWADRTGSLVAPFLVHLIWDLTMYGSRAAVPDWVF